MSYSETHNDPSAKIDRLKQAALSASPLVFPLAVRYARKHNVNVPKGYVYLFESGIFLMGVYKNRDKITQFGGKIVGKEVEIDPKSISHLTDEDVGDFEEVTKILEENSRSENWAT